MLFSNEFRQKCTQKSTETNLLVRYAIGPSNERTHRCRLERRRRAGPTSTA
jgi:hypothetical protein